MNTNTRALSMGSPVSIPRFSSSGKKGSRWVNPWMSSISRRDDGGTVYTPEQTKSDTVTLAAQMFGLQCKVYMVKVSYQQKPYRRVMMETWGASVVASPSPDTQYGSRVLAEDATHTGSLGMAILLGAFIIVGLEPGPNMLRPESEGGDLNLNGAPLQGAKPGRLRPTGAAGGSAWRRTAARGWPATRRSARRARS